LPCRTLSFYRAAAAATLQVASPAAAARALSAARPRAQRDMLPMVVPLDEVAGLKAAFFDTLARTHVARGEVAAARGVLAEMRAAGVAPDGRYDGRSYKKLGLALFLAGWEAEAAAVLGEMVAAGRASARDAAALRAGFVKTQALERQGAAAGGARAAPGERAALPQAGGPPPGADEGAAPSDGAAPDDGARAGAPGAQGEGRHAALGADAGAARPERSAQREGGGGGESGGPGAPEGDASGGGRALSGLERAAARAGGDAPAEQKATLQ
jgi:hypothetical protein